MGSLRSYSYSEAGDSEAMVEQIRVKGTDMSDRLRAAALSIVAEACAQYDIESEAATHIKKAMDADFGEVWHCVVGSSFGSFVTHSHGSFFYADAGKWTILLFRTN